MRRVLIVGLCVALLSAPMSRVALASGDGGRGRYFSGSYRARIAKAFDRRSNWAAARASLLVVTATLLSLGVWQWSVNRSARTRLAAIDRQLDQMTAREHHEFMPGFLAPRRQELNLHATMALVMQRGDVLKDISSSRTSLYLLAGLGLASGAGAAFSHWRVRQAQRVLDEPLPE